MLVEDLTTVRWSCVHFVTAPSHVRLTEQAKARGLVTHTFSAFDIRADADLFGVLAEAMQFPAYFGRNWDGVDECLRDLAWLPAAGHVLFVMDAVRFWSQASAVAGALVEAWLLSAEHWAGEGVPFHLVFVW